MDWDEIGKGLARRAPYDSESIADVRKLGGLRAIAKRVLFGYSAERIERALVNVHKISHAKQREAEIPVFNARRLSKSEKRAKRVEKKRDALKELKALLKK